VNEPVQAEQTTGEEQEHRDLTRIAAGLLALAGVIQVVLGVMAVAGATSLKDAVHQIETTEGYGRLYFSLPVWGGIFILFGLGVIASARAALRRTEAGWLAGLIFAFLGLAVTFFGLPIFRLPAVAALVLLLMAAFLLAYHSRRAPR
jgi:hypothetical protein